MLVVEVDVNRAQHSTLRANTMGCDDDDGGFHETEAHKRRMRLSQRANTVFVRTRLMDKALLTGTLNNYDVGVLLRFETGSLFGKLTSQLSKTRAPHCGNLLCFKNCISPSLSRFRAYRPNP